MICKYFVPLPSHLYISWLHCFKLKVWTWVILDMLYGGQELHDEIPLSHNQVLLPVACLLLLQSQWELLKCPLELVFLFSEGYVHPTTHCSLLKITVPTYAFFKIVCFPQQLILNGRHCLIWALRWYAYFRNRLSTAIDNDFLSLSLFFFNPTYRFNHIASTMQRVIILIGFFLINYPSQHPPKHHLSMEN